MLDNATAEGVNPSTYQPIGRTQDFNSTDSEVWSWVELANVPPPSHNVTWAWITPSGNVYFTVNYSIPSPSSGEWSTYYLDSYINVCCTMQYLPGGWQVHISLDGVLLVSQKFTMNSPYLSPQEIRDAYDVNTLLQSGYTGEGVTVAIVNSGVDGTFYTDVEAFDAAYGLPSANITVVTPNGPSGTNVETPPGETTGDVEFVHAMAPDAHILLVLVGTGSFFSGFSYVINNDAADIASVSPSWYWAGASYQGEVTAENAEFGKGAGEGITLIAASNDWGSNNSVPWGTVNGAFWTTYLPDSWLMPQYSPYFTAVGGTALTVTDGQYAGETGWNQSGGGPSNLFLQPSWQTAPGVPSNGYRDIPDIALDASCSTGYAFYWNGSLGYFCGTSGGAPTFAGIVADIVQAAGHSLGLLNPSLYSLASSDPSAFHEVTSGCSLVKVTPSSPTTTGYCAHSGWNFVTGLGSPDAVALLRYLVPNAALSGDPLSGDSVPPSVASSAILLAYQVAAVSSSALACPVSQVFRIDTKPLPGAASQHR